MNLDLGVVLLTLVVTVPLTVAGCLIVFTGVLRRFQTSADRLEAVLSRMETSDATVARGRTLIADNLASSVSRADATVGPEGAAADAALRTGDSAAAIRRRQGE